LSAVLGTVLEVAILLVLPQLAGLLVTRIARRTTWVAWPAAAIAVFGAAFYLLMWAPARAINEQQMDWPCGTWMVALGFGLLVGIVIHLGAGILFGLLARRLRRSARP
jgi:hypothetical protein